MEKKFLSKAKLQYSTIISWWNDGTERKPSFTDFLSIPFNNVKNPNMKWVSLFNIELTVPTEFEYNFFKISILKKDPLNPDDDLESYEYYYVEKVLDVNSRNKKLLLTLDIWCTYIIGQVHPQLIKIHEFKVQTNRYLKGKNRFGNGAELNNLAKINSYGYPTNNFSWGYAPWITNKNNYKYNGFLNGIDIFYGNSMSLFGHKSSNALSRNGEYKYYVFLSGDTTEDVKSYVENVPGVGGNVGYQNNYTFRKLKRSSRNVIIIPVLFEWTGNLVCRKKSNSLNDRLDFENGRAESNNSILKFGQSDWYLSKSNEKINYFLFNDEDNLIRLAERVNQHKSWSGLSKFVGVFYGENFFKFVTKKTIQGTGNNQTEILNPVKDEYYREVIDVHQNSSGNPIDQFFLHNFLLMSAFTKSENNKPSKYNLGGFACAKIGVNGLDINDMRSGFVDNDDGSKFEPYSDKVCSLVEKNLHLLGDPNYNFYFGSNKVYFTDRFVYTNGYNKYELDSEIPLLLDDYYNTLAATKPQRDAALRTAAGNLATSAVRDWLPPAIHGNGVFAEKTAWGGYWNTQADYLNVKSATGFMSQLHPEDWVVSPKGSILKPWANKNALLEAQKSRLVGDNLKQIGSADKLMGKTSLGLGIASSAANVIGSSIQFANTIYGLKKQVEQIRLTTSTYMTSTAASFIDKKNLLDKVDNITRWYDNVSIQENQEYIYDSVFRDLFVGYKFEDKYDIASYYGQEMFYKNLDYRINSVLNGWVVMSDGEMLYRELFNAYKKVLRNDIIQAIVQMLTQGVRILPPPRP